MSGRPDTEPKSRIPGIDVARGLAIIGMLAVHIGPTHLSDPSGRLYALLTHGRASILFGLLAGVAVSILAAGRSSTPATARLRLLWFAVVLLPLGLWLQGLNISVLVIISNYALLFLLGAACLGLSDRTILGSGLAVAVTGPLAFLIGKIVDPRTFNRSAVDLSDTPAEILHGLALSGPYPFITWAAPFLIGMWLGRQPLGDSGVRIGMVVVGGVTMIAAASLAGWLEGLVGPPSYPIGWLRVLDASPHSQMPPWLIGATGSAVFALGLCLILADRLGWLLSPLSLVGQLALSIYVGHLLALHFLGSTMRSGDPGEALGIIGVILAVSLVIGGIWRYFLPRGPLESVLALPWTLSAWPEPRHPNSR